MARKPANSLQEQDGRDRKGRFTPGTSGNPKGRAPGSKNRLVALADMMLTAVENQGGQDYIDRVAREHPVAFLRIIGRMLPTHGELALRTAQAERLPIRIILTEDRGNGELRDLPAPGGGSAQAALPAAGPTDDEDLDDEEDAKDLPPQGPSVHDLAPGLSRGPVDD